MTNYSLTIHHLSWCRAVFCNRTLGLRIFVFFLLMYPDRLVRTIYQLTALVFLIHFINIDCFVIVHVIVSMCGNSLFLLPSTSIVVVVRNFPAKNAFAFGYWKSILLLVFALTQFFKQDNEIVSACNANVSTSYASNHLIERFSCWYIYWVLGR